jgi:hypothetical protein
MNTPLGIGDTFNNKIWMLWRKEESLAAWWESQYELLDILYGT